MSPFEIVMGYNPSKPIDLVPLPITSRPSESARSFAQYMHDLHSEIRNKIILSNPNYKEATDSHCRLHEFKKRDSVMIRIRLERCPQGAVRKLTTCRVGLYRVLKKRNSNAFWIFPLTWVLAPPHFKHYGPHVILPTSLYSTLSSTYPVCTYFASCFYSSRKTECDRRGRPRHVDTRGRRAHLSRQLAWTTSGGCYVDYAAKATASCAISLRALHQRAFVGGSVFPAGEK